MNRQTATRLILETIGSPIGQGSILPRAEDVEEAVDDIFKSRVGLLFLDTATELGVELGPQATVLHRSLANRREQTSRVIAKLAATLNDVANGEWVLFKSIKPFASTPNDTDWFPLNPRMHGALVDHLLKNGDFHLLETAPRQTTLTEASGAGTVDTTKRGGIYYVDCYRFPSTDYFQYLDTRHLRSDIEYVQFGDQQVPVLAPHAELCVLSFHNVFPERSFSHESYYLVKSYLDILEERDTLHKLIEFAIKHRMEWVLKCNLAMARDIDSTYFHRVDARIQRVLESLGGKAPSAHGFRTSSALPFEFSNLDFWGAFLSKQRDPVARRSTMLQAVHMLNPVFFADVAKIIWRRSVRGGVYEQN
jgi:hypothetical protein